MEKKLTDEEAAAYNDHLDATWEKTEYLREEYENNIKRAKRIYWIYFVILLLQVFTLGIGAAHDYIYDRSSFLIGNAVLLSIALVVLFLFLKYTRPRS
jgi:hypothetical protein